MQYFNSTLIWILIILFCSLNLQNQENHLKLKHYQSLKINIIFLGYGRYAWFSDLRVILGEVIIIFTSRIWFTNTTKFYQRKVKRGKSRRTDKKSQETLNFVYLAFSRNVDKEYAPFSPSYLGLTKGRSFIFLPHFRIIHETLTIVFFYSFAFHF